MTMESIESQPKDDNYAMQHSIYKLDIKLIPNIKASKDNKLRGIAGKLCELLEAEQMENGRENGDHGKYYYYKLKSKALTNGFKGLFLFKTSESRIKEIQNFLSNAIELGFKPKESIVYSTILFLWSKNNIYAITTGYARFSITPYIENSFGLKLMSKYKDIISVRTQCTNPLHGLVHENAQKFASPVPISYVTSSSDLLNRISGFIETGEIFNLNLKKKIQIVARDHIKLSHKFSLKKLTELLNYLDSLQTLNDELNTVKMLSHNDSEEILSAISEQNLRDLYIYPQDDEDFDTDEEWQIKYDNKEAVSVKPQNLCDVYRDFNEKLRTNVEVKSFLQKSLIKFGADDSKYCSLYKTLNGEIQLKNSYYSLIYGKLYYFDTNICDRVTINLKARLDGIAKRQEINEIFAKITIKQEDDEDTIIKKICDNLNIEAYPLHKIIYSKIEFADILIKQDKNIYIVHVKRGFNNTMRDLQKQMELSAQIFSDCKYENKSHDEFWENLNTLIISKKVTGKDNKITSYGCYAKLRAQKCEKLEIELGEKNIKEYLLEHNITYVALLVGDISLESLPKSPSVTAKLCLERTIKYFNDLNIPINVATLKPQS